MRPERRLGTRSEPYVFAKSCSCQKCTEIMRKLQSQTQAGNPEETEFEAGKGAPWQVRQVHAGSSTISSFSQGGIGDLGLSRFCAAKVLCSDWK